MTTALITGGAGFIGSNLVDLLIENDFTVKVLDNLSTGKKSNLPNKVELITGSITNSEDVLQAIKNVEMIFHLAAQASVAISMKNPILDATVNTLGTLELLKHAHQKEIDNFIFASTGGAIYGEPKTMPVSEKHDERPISVYGTSKLAAEKYIKFYQTQGLKSSILRFANVYGPRQDPFGEAGVISIFLSAAKSKKPLQVFGDGSSSRDYIYVQDVAEAALAMSKNPYSEPINLGSGKETPMTELLEVIKTVVGSKDVKILFGPERVGDVHRIYLNSDLIMRHLHWKPKFTLENGIQRVWDWINTS